MDSPDQPEIIPIGAEEIVTKDPLETDMIEIGNEVTLATHEIEPENSKMDCSAEAACIDVIADSSIEESEISHKKIKLDTSTSETEVSEKCVIMDISNTALKDESLMGETLYLDQDDEDFGSSMNHGGINNVINLLKSHQGSLLKILYEDVFKALFYTTESMLKSLTAWPESVTVSRLSNRIIHNYTAMIVTVNDSNRMVHVVAFGLFAVVKEDAFNWFLQNLRKEIPADTYHTIKCIFAEKSLVETEIKTVFPDLKAHVKFSNSLDTFRRAIGSVKFRVPSKKLESCMKMFSELVFSRSEGEYDRVCTWFSTMMPIGVTEYFNQEWHPYREQWTVYGLPDGCFVEIVADDEVENKIKQYIPEKSNVVSFTKDFLEWLDVMKKKLHRTFLQNYKTLASPNSSENNDYEVKYSKLLTLFAYNYVLKEIAESVNVCIFPVNSYFVVKENNMQLRVTTMNCECLEFRVLMLPCKHIFAYRSTLNESFYCEELCNKRWTKQYLLSTHEESEPLKIPPNLTKKASKLANQLFTLLLNDPSKLESRLKLVEDVVSMWSKGHDLTIPTVENGSATETTERSVVETNAKKFSVYRYNKENEEPCKFASKSNHDKLRWILSWVVESPDVIAKTLDGDYVLKTSDLILVPSKLPHSILHESVELKLLMNYATPHALENLKTIVQKKRLVETWTCCLCQDPLEDDCILCSSCLLWHHLKCAHLSSSKKRKTWFCDNCKYT